MCVHVHTCVYVCWLHHYSGRMVYYFSFSLNSLSIEESDFQSLALNNRMVTATEDIGIQLFSDNDAVTLEYNDTVILRFIVNPGLAPLIQQLQNEGEYIRDTAVVDIIDNDSK